MKGLIIVIFLCLGYSANAQSVKASFIPWKSEFKMIVTDSASNTVRLIGKVMFETNKVKFKADQIIINKSTNQVTAIGSLDIFSVPRLASSFKSPNNILKYVTYIE